MNVFNSLGSNYDLQYVLKSILLKEYGKRDQLVNFLEKKYSGKVILFYKARQAITQALILSKLPKDSKVAVTGFTCIAVVDAVRKAGYNPCFLDIEKDTLNFSADELREKVKKDRNIRAVIIQNTLGIPCEIEKIQKVCKENKLVLIEDLAHSIGTFYKSGVESGMLGDFTVLSFSQDKVIDGVSGGALIIRRKIIKLTNQLRSKTKPNFQDKYYPLFTWVIRKTYPFVVGKALHFILKHIGLLSNPMKVKEDTLSDWHAMLALEELRSIEKNIYHRRKMASIYAENISAKIVSKKIIQRFGRSTNIRFPIFVKNRDLVTKKLNENGVYVSDIWYDKPVAPLRYFNSSGYKLGSCPNAEKISQTVLNLPTHKNITEYNALNICNLVNLWAK